MMLYCSLIRVAAFSAALLMVSRAQLRTMKQNIRTSGASGQR